MTTSNSHPHPHLDLKAVAARVLRHLAHAQSRGRLVRLDELACTIGVRRSDVRRVVTSLHAEGHVDAQRMKLTMTGLALAASMRDLELREPRLGKRSRQTLVA
jgi:DNA-binding IclR family transcriptional regulator